MLTYDPDTSLYGEIYYNRTSGYFSSRQPITGHHTNQTCPEPSIQAKKANTSILTVPYLDKPPANLAAHRDLHNEVCVFETSICFLRSSCENCTDENVATVMKVGRVAIITRGRYAGKKVRQSPIPEQREGEAPEHALKGKEATRGRDGFDIGRIGNDRE